MMTAWFSVACGGALGALSRYAISRMVVSTFPFSTMLVNISGSFLMSFLLVAFLSNRQLHDPLRLFVLTGFMGGFTTLSTFNNDLYDLIEKNLYRDAILYAFGSIVLSFLAFLFGIYCARKWGL